MQMWRQTTAVSPPVSVLQGGAFAVLAKCLLKPACVVTAFKCELQFDRTGRADHAFESTRLNFISFQPWTKLIHGLVQRYSRRNREKHMMILKRHLLTLRKH